MSESSSNLDTSDSFEETEEKVFSDEGETLEELSTDEISNDNGVEEETLEELSTDEISNDNGEEEVSLEEETLEEPPSSVKLLIRPTTETVERVVRETIAPQPQINCMEVLSLDEMLIKRDNETLEFFTMRSAYSRAASKVYNNQLNPVTSTLLGEMATNRVLYGINYPVETNNVLDYISSQI